MNGNVVVHKCNYLKYKALEVQIDAKYKVGACSQGIRQVALVLRAIYGGVGNGFEGWNENTKEIGTAKWTTEL